MENDVKKQLEILVNDLSTQKIAQKYTHKDLSKVIDDLTLKIKKLKREIRIDEILGMATIQIFDDDIEIQKLKKEIERLKRKIKSLEENLLKKDEIISHNEKLKGNR
jgi:polyhydroxyalkanoate synthesis regulator phasin